MTFCRPDPTTSVPAAAPGRLATDTPCKAEKLAPAGRGGAGFPTLTHPAGDRQLVLLPAWQERLRQVPPDPGHQAEPALVIPRNPSCYSGQLTLVENVRAARDMLELVRQRSIGFVGLDAEFGHDHAGVVIDDSRTAHDPRSVRPLLLSLAYAEPED